MTRNKDVCNNYVNIMERRDAQVLTKFNQDKKFFKNIIFNQKGARIDATAIDRKDRKCHVEMKQRTGKYANFSDFLDEYNTIYIDCGKLDYLSDIMQVSGYVRNEQELFVSIFNDGDVILIHNLNEPQPIMWLPNQRVYNPAKKRWEYEHKIGLYWYYATIYEKNEDGHYEKWTDDDIMMVKARQDKYSKMAEDIEANLYLSDSL